MQVHAGISFQQCWTFRYSISLPLFPIWFSADITEMDLSKRQELEGHKEITRHGMFFTPVTEQSIAPIPDRAVQQLLQQSSVTTIAGTSAVVPSITFHHHTSTTAPSSLSAHFGLPRTIPVMLKVRLSGARVFRQCYLPPNERTVSSLVHKVTNRLADVRPIAQWRPTRLVLLPSCTEITSDTQVHQLSDGDKIEVSYVPRHNL